MSNHIKKPDFIDDMENIYGGTPTRIIIGMGVIAVCLVIIVAVLIVQYLTI